MIIVHFSSNLISGILVIEKLKMLEAAVAMVAVNQADQRYGNGG